MVPQPLWIPSSERIKHSNFQRYFSFLKEHHGLHFKTYDDLYTWSVQDVAKFWESIWKFCEVKASSYTQIMGLPNMPGTTWFKGTTLNFSENLLRYQDSHMALIEASEREISRSMTYRELFLNVAKCSYALKQLGVQKGDRICGYLPNISETVIAMLATSSLGAIWSSCSPDFGTRGILDRFGQIKPKILFTADGYLYNGKYFDSLKKVSEVSREIPSIEMIIVIPYIEKELDLSTLPKAIPWNTLLNNPATDITFEHLPFNHPLYIMYSSGTTGVPKCIVHGQGGTLIQHLKELILHTDLKREDTICYITTCGWMMWNWLVSSLSVGATIVLTEGSATHPDIEHRWKMIDQKKITIFGTSPKFISLCQKSQVIPSKVATLSTLRTILSTGSPLSKDNFSWIYEHVKKDVQLSSICGGTDIISCFMLGNPLLPVHSEEIQCRGLGMKVEAYDDKGHSVISKKGELVCTAPFPSMPIYFWDDPKNDKYKKAYFQKYPHIWHHGDFIEITPHGGVIVYGRSDATLNPGGIRIGTAEIYRQVETIAEIKDSIAVAQRWEDDVRIILFVILKEGQKLTDELVIKIKRAIKGGASPRHVPAKILVVNDIPYTISGKKVEIAVTRIIHHEAVENKEALINPESLDQFRNRVELKT